MFLALVVISIWFFSRWTLLLLATLYVAHGLVGKLWGLLRWRKRDTKATDEPALS